MNRIVFSGIAAFALLIGAGLAFTESSAQAGHGCGGGLFSGHHRGGCGGGGLFSGHHRNRGCGGGHQAHHGRSGCGGGLLARLHARHNRNNCCAPEPTCCAPAPAPVCCEPTPAPAPCCEPTPTDCCGSAGYAQPVQGYSQGYAQPGCAACAGGEVIVDSGAGQAVQGAPVAPPAPPQQDGGQQGGQQQGGGQQPAPEAPPQPQPEQTEA